MARSVYGGGGAAQVVSLAGTPTVAPASVYSARTGGGIVTDILNIGGGALAGTVTPDSFGQVLFQGPDNYTAPLWLDFGSGPRWAVHPADLNAIVETKRAELLAAEKTTPSGYTQKANLPYTANTIGHDQMNTLDGMVRPRFANGAAKAAAFPTPADGDMAFMQDTHVSQTYLASAGRWVAPPQLIGEWIAPDATFTSVTFSGIPNTFKSLMMVWYGRCSGSGAGDNIFHRIRMQFNGDTTTNYSSAGRTSRVRYSSGTVTYDTDGAGAGGVSSGTAVNMGDLNNGYTSLQGAITIGYMPGSTTTANLRGGGWAVIPGYAYSGFKSASGQSGFGFGGGNSTTYACNSNLSGGWAATAAITEVQMYAINSAFFATGTSFSLYGLS